MIKDFPKDYGTPFERTFISFLAILNGFMLIYLAVQGPLWLNHIRYKTHPIVINQLLGQDVVNLFVMSPLLIVGGILLILKKQLAKYFLILSPLYLLYFTLSYMIGWEWMGQNYSGNSHLYFFHFLFVLISAFLILLYTLHIFPKHVTNSFSKKGLTIYSIVYSVFLLMFASMWIKGVTEVMTTGTYNGYDIAPTAFWLVRTIDLGFCIPLGFVSIYLLWVRPNQSYAIQFLFYGFFSTQIVAVLAMALMMYIHHDPTFVLSQTLVFLALAVIVFSGFGYILRNYKRI
jgi:hypothetical protein